MKTLYIDCTNGIAGDMLLQALEALGGDTAVEDKLHWHAYDKEGALHHHHHGVGHPEAQGHSHEGNSGHRHPETQGHSHEEAQGDHHGQDPAPHSGHSHRSLGDVQHILRHGTLDPQTVALAEQIYGIIARAEGQVHGAAPEEVHFHEVGRDQAIINMAGIAHALGSLGVQQILCSPIHDGQGTIQCAHGIIPVPVPAVKAMMAMPEAGEYEFMTDQVFTEMVTPSGLAALLGLGAKAVKENIHIPEDAQKAVARGKRDTGREGLRVYLFEGEAL